MSLKAVSNFVLPSLQHDSLTGRIFKHACTHHEDLHKSQMLMLGLPVLRCNDAEQGYYQEAGRAGRDGQRSECILLYAARDIPRIVRLLRSGKGRSKAKFDRGFALLNQVSSSSQLLITTLCLRGNRAVFQTSRG